MTCPRCELALEPETVEVLGPDLRIDVCPGCRGTWYDRGEVAKVIKDRRLQSRLVEFPEVGDSFAKWDAFGVVESVKAASDLYMPVGGEIVEVNEALEDEPEQVNSDPYGAGWMIKIRPSDPGEWESLLSPEDYEKVVEAEE